MQPQVGDVEAWRGGKGGLEEPVKLTFGITGHMGKAGQADFVTKIFFNIGHGGGKLNNIAGMVLTIVLIQAGKYRTKLEELCIKQGLPAIGFLGVFKNHFCQQLVDGGEILRL